MRLSILVVMVLGCGAAQSKSGGGGGGGDHGGGSGPVPADVRKTIEAALGADAHISSEKEDGKLVYEGGRKTKLEVEVDEHGQLLETEVAIPVTSLPEAVAKALAGKGKLEEAEVVVRANGVAFEVEAGEAEYTVDTTGTILATEHEEGDEEGDEHGEGDEHEDHEDRD